MKLSSLIAPLVAGSLLATATLAPSTAQAQWRHREETKNTWRNVALGSAGVALLGLLTHKDTVTALGAAGAAYSGWRYEEDRKHERWAREHAYYYQPRNYGYYNTPSYEGSSYYSSYGQHRYYPSYSGYSHRYSNYGYSYPRYRHARYSYRRPVRSRVVYVTRYVPVYRSRRVSHYGMRRWQDPNCPH